MQCYRNTSSSDYEVLLTPREARLLMNEILQIGIALRPEAESEVPKQLSELYKVLTEAHDGTSS